MNVQNHIHHRQYDYEGCVDVRTTPSTQLTISVKLYIVEKCNMNMVEISDVTTRSKDREHNRKINFKHTDSTIFESYPNDLKMRALKYMSEGHTASYVLHLLKREGFERLPSQVTLYNWQKRMYKLGATKKQEHKQVELLLNSTQRIAKEFEWLHNLNRELVEGYYKDPFKYSRELMFSIREFHSQLRTAMEKLDMLRSNINITYDVKSIMLTNEFNVATHRYLEDLLKENKIQILDKELRTMVMGRSSIDLKEPIYVPDKEVESLDSI